MKFNLYQYAWRFGEVENRLSIGTNLHYKFFPTVKPGLMEYFNCNNRKSHYRTVTTKKIYVPSRILIMCRLRLEPAEPRIHLALNEIWARSIACWEHHCWRQLCGKWVSWITQVDLTAIYLNSWSHFAGLNEVLKTKNLIIAQLIYLAKRTTGTSMFNVMKGT